MALFDTLKTILTPYAEKINGHTVDIHDLNTAVDSLNKSLGKYTDTPILTQNDVVTGGYINGNSGFKVDGQSYVCTDFIEIPSDSVGLLLSANCYFGSVIGYAFYAAKSSNSFISGGTGTGWTVKPINVIVPEGARFFRTSLDASGYTDPSDFGISYQRRISDIDEVSFIDYGQWEQGSIDSTTGSISNRNDRILDRNYYDVSKIDIVLSAEGFQILCASYSTADISGFIGLSSWANYHTSFSGRYVRFSVRKSSGADITPDEDTGFELRYKSQSVNEALAKQDAEINKTNRETAEKSLVALGVLPYGAGSKNQIARLGWNVYSIDTPPEQTPQAYALAYKNGCRIMLGDIRVTSDGEYVLWHDETLNNSVKHTDGTNLSTAEKAMTIAGSTLEELNAFDYGLYKGQKYAGMKMPMLDDLLKWCALTNCIPMLEVKVQLSESDCIEISSMCKRYGLGDRVIIDEYYDKLQNTVDYWKTNLPKCTICIIAWGDVLTARDFINANLINTDIPVLLVVSTIDQLYLISTNGVLDYSKVKTVTDLGAKLTYTEVRTSADMDTLYDGGYLDVFSYVASGYIHVNEWIAEKLLIN